jgi:hypothetical protein
MFFSLFRYRLTTSLLVVFLQDAGGRSKTLMDATPLK